MENITGNTYKMLMNWQPMNSQQIQVPENASKTVVAGTIGDATSKILVGAVIIGLGIGLYYVSKTVEYKIESSAARRAGVKYIATD